jgi:short-subunit dehydrogenase involved in D-alanine esterification of teichoic acids
MCAQFTIIMDGKDQEGREEFTVVISNTDPSLGVTINNNTIEIVIEGGQ